GAGRRRRAPSTRRESRARSAARASAPAGTDSTGALPRTARRRSEASRPRAARTPRRTRRPSAPSTDPRAAPGLGARPSTACQRRLLKLVRASFCCDEPANQPVRGGPIAPFGQRRLPILAAPTSMVPARELLTSVYSLRVNQIAHLVRAPR